MQDKTQSKTKSHGGIFAYSINTLSCVQVHRWLDYLLFRITGSNRSCRGSHSSTLHLPDSHISYTNTHTYVKMDNICTYTFSKSYKVVSLVNHSVLVLCRLKSENWTKFAFNISFHLLLLQTNSLLSLHVHTCSFTWLTVY